MTDEKPLCSAGEGLGWDCERGRQGRQPWCTRHYVQQLEGRPFTDLSRLQRLDLNGQTVGFWKVLDELPAHARGTRRMWRCQCACGKIANILQSALKYGKSKSCGCQNLEVRRGPQSAKWKGGRHQNKGGYILVKTPNHPRATGNNYVLEHIVVMEEQLGRSLVPGENVHHKNGNRADNRPENLELWNTSQPAGQRPEDKVAYAKEILGLYEPDALAS